MRARIAAAGIRSFRRPAGAGSLGLNLGKAVKPFRIAMTHGVFVFRREPLVLVQFLQLFLAGIVVDLVREIRREDKRLVADDADRERQGQLVAFDADESARVDQLRGELDRWWNP